MQAFIRFGILAILLTVSTGCLKLSLVVSLKEDGSGTVAFSHLITNASLEEAVKLAKKEGLETSLDKAKERVLSAFTDTIMLNESARQYGKVSFSKVDKIQTATHTGVTVTYAFKDINEVKIDAITPLGAEWQGGVNYGASFSYTPDTRTLLITTNEGDAAQQQKIDDAQIDMLLQQLDASSGTSASIDVILPGPILQTDASQADSPSGRISVFNIDLDTLKQNRPALKQAMQTNNSFEGLLKLKLKGIHAEKQGSSVSASF